MTPRSAQAVPVVPAQEAAAPSRVVATHHLRPHRTRPIRVQGDAVEVAIGDAVAGEKVEGVDAGAHIHRRLHLLPPAGRRTAAGLHLLPLVLGVRDETIRDGPGLGLGLAQDPALEVRACVGTEAIERPALDLRRDPVTGMQSGIETGVGVGAGVLVAADRLPDAVESGVDRIPRRGVDRALQRVEDATKNAIGVDLVLLRREGTAGVLGIGATAVAVKVGIQSGAEGAPEVGQVPALVLALLFGDVVALEADLN